LKSWLFTTLHRESSQNLSPPKSFFKRINRRRREVCRTCRRTARTSDSANVCFAFWAKSAKIFVRRLVLYYMEDLSYKEIADVLTLPLGTVQSRIARRQNSAFAPVE